MNRGTFLFTVDEYHRMIDHGILTKEDRLELIRGRLMPKNGVIKKQSDGEPAIWKYETFHFTVDEYHRMIETGVLTEDDRVELIRGEIVPKMSIGPRHAGRVVKLNGLFSTRLAGRVLVNVQSPLVLQDSEPEPDLMLVRPRDDFYESDKPRPNDVFLVVEVADTSLDDDRSFKMPLYAENGIGEYWIVNLIDDCLEVHRTPEPTGYRDKQILKTGDQIEILALPGVIVQVSDLL